MSRHIQSLRLYAEQAGARLERASLPECVYGRTCRDRITLHVDLPPEQELATLIHELTHWLVHRPGGTSHECTLFEYEAEAVEALVLRRIGVSARSRTQDPLQLFLESPMDGLLAASVDRARSASQRITEALGAGDS